MLDGYRAVFSEECRNGPCRWDYENDYYRELRERYWYCGVEDGPTIDMFSLVSVEDPQAFVATLLIV